jgi:flagellar hook-length control protein FliK
VTQALPALNKAQPQTKAAAVQGNYAAAPQQDTATENYADLLAGITQESSQQAAQHSGLSEQSDTALPADAAAIEAALAAAAPTDITDIVTAELLPMPAADSAAMQQSRSDSQTNTVAALNLSYSFAAERSVFYSNMQTDIAANLNAVAQNNSTATAGQTAAMAALAASAATATATEAQRQAVTEQTLLTQQAQQNSAAQQTGLSQQTTLPLQGTSLQQFIRQAQGAMQQQDSSAAVSSTAAAANPLGGPASGAEAALSFKADLAGLQSSQWGQKLVHLLSDKINLQLGQQIQRAQIRLDPPQLGVIELSVSVDGDRTTVQLYAANSQVREAMQQNLDQLRQQLAQRLGAEQNLQLDVRDQAQQQQTKQQGAVAQHIATQYADDAAELNSAAAMQQTTGWLDRLV